MSKNGSVRQIRPRGLGMLALVLALLVLNVGEEAASSHGMLEPYESSVVSGV